MKSRLAAAILSTGLLSSGAHADGYGVLIRGQSVRVTARVATQGLGYSVLRERAGPVSRANRVLAVCAIDETFAEAYCPTAQYVAYCPSARIICQ